MSLQIQRFEKLSKFDLPESERAWIQEKADMLLASFESIEKIDTSGVVPLVSPVPLTNVMREDVAEKLYSRESILSGAPEQCDGYFQVPKTIE